MNLVTLNPLITNSFNKICNSKDNPRYTTFDTKYERCNNNLSYEERDCEFTHER